LPLLPDFSRFIFVFRAGGDEDKAAFDEDDEGVSLAEVDATGTETESSRLFFDALGGVEVVVPESPTKTS